MSDLDSALDRLGDAIALLIASNEDQNKQADESASARVGELTAERDRLQAEVAELQAQRKIDAKLRAEAAEAVKMALGDLRGLVAEQEKSGKAKSGKGGKNG